jgi:predicted TIM-barrel fold metal-dependent hydrolase
MTRRGSGGRYKGIAIIAFDADLAALHELKAQGIVGAAFNPTFHGIDYYKRSADLIGKLAQLDMFLQIQSEHDLLSMFVPWIEAMPIRVLIDHCGRPTPDWTSPASRRCCGSPLPSGSALSCPAIRNFRKSPTRSTTPGHT